MRKNNGRDKILYFSSVSFYDRVVSADIFQRMSRSCLVPLTKLITAGAIDAEGSELNFIGNVSFESNHAFDDGGKGKFEDYISAIS